MSRLGHLAYYGFRGTFIWWSPLAFTGMMVVVPLFLVAILGLLKSFVTGSAVSVESVYPISAYSTAFAVIGAVVQLPVRESQFGALEHVVVSARDLTELYLVRGVGILVVAQVSLLASIVGSTVLVGEISPEWIVRALLASLAVAFSALAFGLTLGSAALVTQSHPAVASVGGGLVLLFAGAVVPVEELPGAIQVIANIVPAHHAIRYITGAAGLEGLGFEACVAAGYFVFGALAWNASHGIARRRGSYTWVP